MIKRVLITVCVSVGLLFLLSSCQNENSNPKEESVIVIGTTESVTVLDPVHGFDLHTAEILRNTLGGLLKYTPGTTELVPGLAEEMPTASPDAKEWTFKLRHGLEFSDGTPFNAEVMKYSIDRALTIKGQASWLVSEYVDSIEIIDEYTVKFVLNGSYSYFPALVASVPYFPVSPNIYPADTELKDETKATAWIGPYKIEKIVRGVEIVLAKNPAYYGEPAKNDKIIIKYYKDATTLALAVERGDIDIAWRSLNPSDIVSLKSKGNLNVIESKSVRIRYLCLTCNRKPFIEKKIRQAIAFAINRASIVDKVFMNSIDPLYSMVPDGMWSHKDASKDTVDLAKSRELLESLGYSAANPFSFELWYTPTHYGPAEADMALLIKQNLEDTGIIKVKLESAEYGTYNENYDRGNMDAFFKGWSPDFVDPDNYTTPFALTGASAATGIYYSNPKMDELLRKGQTTVDYNERVKIYEEIQNYWAEENPTIPLLQERIFLVAQNNIHGIEVAPSIIFYYDTIYRK